MDENLFETQYNVTKKSKLKRFYEENKILLYSSIFILMIFIFSLIYYLDTKERKQNTI